MRRLATYTLIVAATIAVLILLWQFRSIFILLALSLMVAAALRPSIDALIERGMPATLARVLIYLLLIGALGAGLYFASGPLLDELQLLSNYLVVLYESTYQRWEAGTGLQEAIVARLPAPDQLAETMTGQSGLAIVQLLFGAAQSVVGVLASVLIIVVLSLYWSSDRAHFERLWLSLLPANQRVQARTIYQQTETSMGAYLRSEFVQALLAVIMLALAFSVLGLDYPLLTALLAGVAWLVPIAGFVFAVGLSFIFGLASSGGLELALSAVLITGVVMAFLEFVIEPRFFQRNEFSGLLIVLLVLLMVDAYGLIGFVIAPPLAVLLQISISHFARVMQRPAAPPIQIESLEERLAQVQTAYSAQVNGESPTPLEVGSLLERLDALVDRARAVAIERE
ncbi:AI-2E family transporter [Promineifilum sp.]|uniref:AI-2E family transporter n=1 Tax=Promineifilum sp. TaxID=2664178 RepID=UPI0035AE28DD